MIIDRYRSMNSWVPQKHNKSPVEVQNTQSVRAECSGTEAL